MPELRRGVRRCCVTDVVALNNDYVSFQIQVEGSLLYKGKGGIGKVFVGWRISGGNEPTAGASILVGMGTSYYGSFVATETEDQCCFLRRSSTWHIVIYGPFASPANLDLVENQRQSSSGEFSRIEKRNGATKITFHSKSMPRGCNDKKYDLFRTMSGKLERQISNLRGKPIDTSLQDKEITESLTAERFLEALQGPELETLKEMEKIVLPEDKTWPFLLRFPVTSFGMCLGVSSQAIMWKTLATTKAEKFLHLTQVVNHVLWWISLVLLVSFSITYLFKTIFFFEAVRREFKHPIRVNFFFAPLISVLFLALGIPHSITSSLPSILWYFFMAPILLLEMKIYGQWMSGGQRRLSKVANPTNHLSIVGNFAGALLGASLGLKEGPMFFFSVGLAYYLVLFVTLYQRLPTNETLPKELHPVFFLFVAAPAVASMAWTTISASFDIGSRIAYFISLFLYFSLVVRINFFRGFKFSLAWWAYTFPMTAVATATIKYSGEVNGLATQILAVLLSGAATLTVIGVLVLTVVHAFVKRDLFPNDFAIAISAEQPKQKKWLKQLINGSLENSTRGLKVLDPEDTRIDIEAPPLSNAVCHTV